MCHVVKHQFERDADSMSDKVRLCAGHDSTGPWAINSQARALGARALERGASWCVASVRQLVRWHRKVQFILAEAAMVIGVVKLRLLH